MGFLERRATIEKRGDIVAAAFKRPAGHEAQKIMSFGLTYFVKVTIIFIKLGVPLQVQHIQPHVAPGKLQRVSSRLRAIRGH